MQWPIETLVTFLVSGYSPAPPVRRTCPKATREPLFPSKSQLYCPPSSRALLTSSSPLPASVSKPKHVSCPFRPAGNIPRYPPPLKPAPVPPQCAVASPPPAAAPCLPCGLVPSALPVAGPPGAVLCAGDSLGSGGQDAEPASPTCLASRLAGATAFQKNPKHLWREPGRFCLPDPSTPSTAFHSHPPDPHPCPSTQPSGHPEDLGSHLPASCTCTGPFPP